MDEEDEREECEDSGSDTKSSSEEQKDVFSVEKIVSHKRLAGKYKYRIRWSGFSPDEDTWEPEDNLIGDYCQRMLAAYKSQHNIADQEEEPDRKKPRYEYVDEPMSDSEKKEWFVSGTEKDREIRNLFVHDRILDDTEKALTDLQDTGSRLTRSQRRMIFHSDEKGKSKSGESSKAKRRPKQTAQETPTSSKKSVPPKSKKKQTKSKTKQDKRISDHDSSVSKSESLDTDFKESSSESTVSDKPVIKKPVESQPKKSPQPKTGISMVGKDPKQSVPSAFASNSLSSFRIPKKPSTSASPTVKPTTPPKPKTTEPVKPVGTKATPTKKPPIIVQNESVVAQSAVPLKPGVKKDFFKNNDPRSGYKTQQPGTSTNFGNKPIHWQTAKDMIQEKACNLPSTKYSLTATLNIPPSQLSSYSHLSINPTPTIGDKITQQAFNDAVLGCKISAVRSALRNKAHGLDLDFVDPKGRTLLHRLAEANCDQQHTQDEIIDCLVNAGANMTIVDNDYSRTPLHTAVYSRRFCHVRKLVQLGSSVNTEDFREESPLVTALKMNNTEIVKFLLSSGATYQAAFSNKFSLTKTQQKPVLNYQNALQEAMKKARSSVLSDIQFVTFMSPVFQVPLHETQEFNFNVTNKQDPHHQRLCPILMLSLIDPGEQKVRATSWGESPIEVVYLNGNELELVHERNRFFYVAAPLSVQNSINITFDRARSQYSKRILAAQVFGVDLNTGSGLVQ